MPQGSLTIKGLREEIRKDRSAIRSACRLLSERIKTVDSKVRAYAAFDDARFEAEVERLTEEKDPSVTGKPLFGVPISLKDNLCVRGWETTCASRILKGYVPPYDATVIQKLRANGAIIFGKCNMDEFAFGSSTESSCYGPTANPWDLSRVPGGSSGGSAACVAADEAIAALGSDTGGSIRQPASLCGVVGVKPTYGRVSRYGLIAFGSSLDQIGPLAKTVEDAAILTNVISGHDPKDSTSANAAVPDFTRACVPDVKGLRVGLPKEYFVAGLDREVETAVRNAAEKLASMGAVVTDISLPHTEYAVAVYYIVAVAEASSNLGRFDGVQYGYRHPANQLLDMYFETRDHGFGSEAKRRILLGTFVLSAGYYDAYYLKGQKVRTLIKRDFDHAFKQVDVILTPVSPTPAFKIGERTQDPLAMYLSDIFTIPMNLAGIPAISVPCGFSKGNLPIGVQFAAKHFDEETMFRAAYAFEQGTDFHKRKPEL
ncbi:MAG TPA: Asp-tRNA(Asn)/Glu-tRNA(Gln) amidotransferase subunit GatA [Candidatus Omnitrophota bacterium]|nr:Asp-tRNA(Asn)/Glu-tRNA(Gln) amidotransferase subunit GatA [Candidatus Omnitrophota bacterium]